MDRTAFVALAGDPERSRFARLSARNIEGVTLGRADTMNAFHMLGSRYLVIERSELEAWLRGPWSQTGKDAKISPMGAAPASDAAQKGAA